MLAQQKKNLRKETQKLLARSTKLRFESFGCEVDLNYIPKKYKRAFEKLNLPMRVIKVPHRTKGMTSSGITGRCHCNVGLLVSTYGGKHIKGYALDYSDGILELYWHSVWLTPEGKLVEVTGSNFDFNDFTHFIPCSEEFADPSFVCESDDLRIHEDYKLPGMLVEISRKEDDVTTRELIPFKGLSLAKLMYACNVIPQRKEELKQGLAKENQLGGFIEGSLATGRFLIGSDAFA